MHAGSIGGGTAERGRGLRTAAILVAAAMGIGAEAATLEVETGAFRASRNDIGLPGDTGTRFSLRGLTRGGAEPFVRILAEAEVAEGHGLRVTLAPVKTGGTGVLAAPAMFDGVPFSAGVPSRASYQFNTYRATYLYTLDGAGDWTWRVGLTGLVRDAKVELRQGDRYGSTYDLGFVPLLHADARWRFAREGRLVMDLDAAGASQGRAIDFAIKGLWDVGDGWTVGAGYRTIEGGADNETVYSFAWLHFAVVSVEYRY